MIKIEINRNSQNKIVGYSVTGHSGDYGSSIVCAEISTLAQIALLGIMQHLNREVEHQVSSGKLYMKLKDAPDELTEAILATMLLGMYDVQKENTQEVSIKD